jgi:hypothetical protein
VNKSTYVVCRVDGALGSADARLVMVGDDPVDLLADADATARALAEATGDAYVTVKLTPISFFAGTPPRN